LRDCFGDTEVGYGWLALFLAATANNGDEVTVRALPADNNGHCIVMIDGRRFRSEAELTPFLQRRGIHSIHLEAAVDAPYRCIGWIFFAAQRAGVIRIGGVAELPAREGASEPEQSPGD